MAVRFPRPHSRGPVGPGAMTTVGTMSRSRVRPREAARSRRAGSAHVIMARLRRKRITRRSVTAAKVTEPASQRANARDRQGMFTALVGDAKCRDVSWGIVARSRDGSRRRRRSRRIRRRTVAFVNRREAALRLVRRIAPRSAHDDGRCRGLDFVVDRAAVTFAVGIGRSPPDRNATTASGLGRMSSMPATSTSAKRRATPPESAEASPV